MRVVQPLNYQQKRDFALLHIFSNALAAKKKGGTFVNDLPYGSRVQDVHLTYC